MSDGYYLKPETMDAVQQLLARPLGQLGGGVKAIGGHLAMAWIEITADMTTYDDSDPPQAIASDGFLYVYGGHPVFYNAMTRSWDASTDHVVVQAGDRQKLEVGHRYLCTAAGLTANPSSSGAFDDSFSADFDGGQPWFLWIVNGIGLSCTKIRVCNDDGTTSDVYMMLPAQQSAGC